MSKHTPGNLIHDSQEASYIRAEDGGLIAILGWSNGRNFSKGRRAPEDVIANAKLLAAAPDLLAAIRILVGCTENIGGTHSLAIDNAKAAIAKATGSQS